MSNTLELCTEGTWKAHDSDVYSDLGHMVASTANKYHTEIDKRIAERRANARLMAEAKAMYRLILEIQHKPINQCVDEMRRIMRSVGGAQLEAVKAVAGEEFTYERP